MQRTWFIDVAKDGVKLDHEVSTIDFVGSAVTVTRAANSDRAEVTITGGEQGPAGPGVPTGGTTGQVLAKTSSTDFATAWVTPSGGSDPWNYARLASDFTTSSATAADITGLGFTPAANQRYEFEGQVRLRTNTTTVNPRLGLAWATGLTDGVANIEESQSATAVLNARGNINAALLIAVGGLPNTTQSWPATVWGNCDAGASPSGSVRLQLSSETAGTVVTAKAGSFIRWRLVP